MSVDFDSVAVEGEMELLEVVEALDYFFDREGTVPAEVEAQGFGGVGVEYHAIAMVVGNAGYDGGEGLVVEDYDFGLRGRKFGGDLRLYFQYGGYSAVG